MAQLSHFYVSYIKKTDIGRNVYILSHFYTI